MAEPRIGEYMKPEELPFTAGEKGNWYKHFGLQFGNIYRKAKVECTLITL